MEKLILTVSDQVTQVNKTELIHQATRSLKWTTLANVAPRFISPLSTLVLAAILTPADFGTVAVSSIVVALAEIVVGFGVGPTVVQRRKMITEVSSAAFWMSFTLACIFYWIIWMLAPEVAEVYQIPLVSPVVRVSGLSLFFFSLRSIPGALLERDLRFHSLFWARFLRQTTYLMTSVVFALLGMGVWALVLGPLVGTVVETIIVWRASGWQPVISINWTIAFSLLGFGTWVMLSGFQSWLFLYADNALAGYFFGAGGLGIYSLGFNLSSLLPGIIIPPLYAVSYPAFCALQDEPLEVGRSLLKIQSLAAILLFPICFGFAAIAVPITALIYGERWQGLGTVIQFLAIMPGLSHLWSLNTNAYRAVNRPEVGAILDGLAVLFVLVLLIIVGSYGLVPFTIARFAAGFAMPLIHILIGNRILGVSVAEQSKTLSVPLGCAVIMFMFAYSLGKLFMPFEGIVGWFKLFIIISISAPIYLLLLWKLDRQVWNRTQLAVYQIVSQIA